MNVKELRFFVIIYIIIIILGFETNISFCPFYNLTKYPCPGCGMTQGIRYILLGEWDMALKSHFFSFFVLLIMILVLLSFFSKSIVWLIEFLLYKKWIWMSALIFILLYGIIRLILLLVNGELYLKFFLYYDYKTVFEFLGEMIKWFQEKYIF